MDTKLPQKYNNSFIEKIKNFFKNLFSVQKENYSLEQKTYTEQNESIEKLQKKYEIGEISASNLNDEQYEKIVNLYKEQINNIKMNITEKENKLKKAII